jgi:hypothetical protein
MYTVVNFDGYASPYNSTRCGSQNRSRYDDDNKNNTDNNSDGQIRGPCIRGSEKYPKRPISKEHLSAMAGYRTQICTIDGGRCVWHKTICDDRQSVGEYADITDRHAGSSEGTTRAAPLSGKQFRLPEH